MIDNQESSRLLDKMKIRGKIPYVLKIHETDGAKHKSEQ